MFPRLDESKSFVENVQEFCHNQELINAELLKIITTARDLLLTQEKRIAALEQELAKEILVRNRH